MTSINHQREMRPSKTAEFSRAARSVFFTLTVLWPSAILAQAPAANPPASGGSGAASGSTGISGSAAVGMPIPLANISIPVLVGRIIKYALGLSGVVAMVMFIIGGLTWMTAQGNQEKITSAKKTCAWSAIGLALVFGSYTLANFVISALQQNL